MTARSDARATPRALILVSADSAWPAIRAPHGAEPAPTPYGEALLASYDLGDAGREDAWILQGGWGTFE
jgi:hypothetical protein